jgi:hypothetical protein
MESKKCNAPQFGILKYGDLIIVSEKCELPLRQYEGCKKKRTNEFSDAITPVPLFHPKIHG